MPRTTAVAPTVSGVTIRELRTVGSGQFLGTNAESVSNIAPLRHSAWRQPIARIARPLIAVVGLVLASCVRQVVPPPTDVVRQWSQAVQTRNTDQALALLTEEGRRAYGAAQVKHHLADNQPELLATVQGALSEGAQTRVRARFVGATGWTAHLVTEQGQFRIDGAVIPSAPYQPQDALRELQLALAHRSFTGLLRVLSAESSQALAREVRSLIVALEDPDAASLDVQGRTATATLPGGHQVTLQRENGNWKIIDFD